MAARHSAMNRPWAPRFALVGAGGLIQLLQVLECDEFYGLGPEQVGALIASDTITVPNEEKVGILLFPPNSCTARTYSGV